MKKPPIRIHDMQEGGLISIFRISLFPNFLFSGMLERHFRKCNMRRNIACTHVPLVFSITREAVESARRHIVAGVSDIDLLRVGIDGKTVWHGYPPLRAISDEIAREQLTRLRIDDGVCDLGLTGQIAELRTIYIQRVTTGCHTRIWNVQLRTDLVCMRVDDECIRWSAVVVAS